MQEIKESFNYGLFLPPVNGKAGKFLEEHRPLADYPFHASVGYVEVRISSFCTINKLYFASKNKIIAQKQA